MGGNHSKSKKSSPDLEQTGEAGANTPKGLQSKNSVKKKKGTRSSVKIKTEKRTLKKQKSVRGADVENVNPGECQLNHKFNSNVYRKKSSCPSCDAKDTLLGKNRSRSGSDKSLRFSDFNKVLRRTRIYDWETSPVEIPLDGVPDPDPEDICYVCGVYTGYHVRICRVCLKAYHDGCLQKIGHPLNDRARHLIATGQWSCHQCVALNHLLTQEEVKKVMEDLEDYDISPEKISEQDYLSYCKQSLIKEGKIFTAEKELSSSERFHMAAHSGYISWNDFLNIESIRILNKRCKDSLVHLLTQAEIAEARKAFRQLDKQGIGLVSKAEVQLFFDGSKSRVSTYFPDNSIIYIDEDLESPVTWAEFLRDRAIYYLGQRPNLSKYASSDNIDKNESAMTPSFHSLDDDDDYITCASDTEPSAKGALIPPCTNSFSDSADGNMPLLITSSTMLEDFKAEMDKCCDRHKLSIDQSDLDLEVSSCCINAQPHLDPDQKLDNKSKREDEPSPRTADDHSLSASPQRLRQSPYKNEGRHQPIPWEDLGNKPQQQTAEDASKQMHRRSEVIHRKQAAVTSARAVSQIGCRPGKNVMAPAYGNLVGRVHSGEWGF